MDQNEKRMIHLKLKSKDFLKTVIEIFSHTSPPRLESIQTIVLLLSNTFLEGRITFNTIYDLTKSIHKTLTDAFTISIQAA
jgi:hypothetical protein